MKYQCRQFSSAGVQLSDSQLIGMGNRRRVFVHPDHSDLCIKVARVAHIRRQLDERGLTYKLMPTRWRDDNWLEAKAYQQPALSQISGASQNHIPTLHGWQETSLGIGLVFDYYHQGDGKPCPNLLDLILSQGVTADIKGAVGELSGYILENSPWMRHPGPANIVFGGDGHLKLIDCMGTFNMHVVRYIPAIRKRRRQRHIDYLHAAINRLHEQYERAAAIS